VADEQKDAKPVSEDPRFVMFLMPHASNYATPEEMAKALTDAISQLGEQQKS
jgi:hypothetical protein